MEQGRWVKLNTNIAEWRWSHKPEYMAFATWCLILANPRPHAFEKMMLERGQFATSLPALSAKIGCTIRTLRTVIRDCEECGFISKKTTHKNTIITVCNYDSYQDSEKQNDTQTTRKRHADDMQTTYGRHANDTQTTRTLEYKNKEYKKEDSRLSREILGANAPLSPEGDGVSDTTPEIPDNGEKTDAADNTLTLTPPQPKKEKNCAKKEKADAIDFDALKEFFNNTMQGRGIHQITSITGKRQQAVAARAREHGKNAIATVIENAAKSKFLNAETPENFLADFNWLFRPENFVKVLEGKYTNRDRAPMQPRPAKLSGAGAVLAAYEELQQKYEQQNGNNNADTGNGSHSTDAATDYLLTLNGF